VEAEAEAGCGIELCLCPFMNSCHEVMICYCLIPLIVMVIVSESIKEISLVERWLERIKGPLLHSEGLALQSRPNLTLSPRSSFQPVSVARAHCCSVTCDLGQHLVVYVVSSAVSLAVLLDRVGASCSRITRPIVTRNMCLGSEFCLLICHLIIK
jgi:hypothetical protein